MFLPQGKRRATAKDDRVDGCNALSGRKNLRIGRSAKQTTAQAKGSFYSTGRREKSTVTGPDQKACLTRERLPIPFLDIVKQSTY